MRISPLVAALLWSSIANAQSPAAPASTTSTSETATAIPTITANVEKRNSQYYATLSVDNLPLDADVYDLSCPDGKGGEWGRMAGFHAEGSDGPQDLGFINGVAWKPCQLSVSVSEWKDHREGRHIGDGEVIFKLDPTSAEAKQPIILPVYISVKHSHAAAPTPTPTAARPTSPAHTTPPPTSPARTTPRTTSTRTAPSNPTATSPSAARPTTPTRVATTGPSISVEAQSGHAWIPLTIPSGTTSFFVTTESGGNVSGLKKGTSGFPNGFTIPVDFNSSGQMRDSVHYTLTYYDDHAQVIQRNAVRITRPVEQRTLASRLTASATIVGGGSSTDNYEIRYPVVITLDASSPAVTYKLIPHNQQGLAAGGSSSGSIPRNGKISTYFVSGVSPTGRGKSFARGEDLKWTIQVFDSSGNKVGETDVWVSLSH